MKDSKTDILNIAKEQTDNAHPLTINGFVSELEKQNKGLRRQAVSLIVHELEEEGLLQSQGKRGGYYYAKRQFPSIDVAKYVIADIAANKFISFENKISVIKNIFESFSRYEREALLPYIKSIKIKRGLDPIQALKIIKAAALAKPVGKTAEFNPKRYVFIELKNGEDLLFSPYPDPTSYRSSAHGDLLIEGEAYGHRQIECRLSDIETIRPAAYEDLMPIENRRFEEDFQSRHNMSAFNFMTTDSSSPYIDQTYSPTYVYYYDAEGKKKISASIEIKKDGNGFECYTYAGSDISQSAKEALRLVKVASQSQLDDPFMGGNDFYGLTLFIEAASRMLRSPTCQLNQEDRLSFKAAVNIIVTYCRTADDSSAEAIAALMEFNGSMDEITYRLIKGRLLSNYDPAYSRLLSQINEGTRILYPVSKKEFSRLVDIAIAHDDASLAAFLAETYAYSPIGPDDSYPDFKRLIEHFYNEVYEYRRSEAYSRIASALRHIVYKYDLSNAKVDTPKGQYLLDLVKKILELHGKPSALRPMPLVEDLNKR